MSILSIFDFSLGNLSEPIEEVDLGELLVEGQPHLPPLQLLLHQHLQYRLKNLILNLIYTSNPTLIVAARPGPGEAQRVH